LPGLLRRLEFGRQWGVALEAHCEPLAEDGKARPCPKPMSDWQADREYKGWTWGNVDVPVERFIGTKSAFHQATEALLAAL
jgi:HicB_like antitoxin of bacterial toxin-antitoxin system